MILPSILKSNILDNTPTPKFHKKAELTTNKRFEIACQAYEAQQNKEYGAITQIAKENNIHRDTVYELLNPLKKSIPKLYSPREKKSK